MDTAAARLDPETLDAVQVVRGRVPIEEFRLLVDECYPCKVFSISPVTLSMNELLRDHIRNDHADRIL